MKNFTNKQTSKLLVSVLISLFSLNLYAADFTIEVNPSANSVDDSKVSSISSSKISDLATVLFNYLLKTDVPDCQAGQFLTKIANSYSCVSPVSQDTNPVGTILAFASGTCPSGYLTADGSSISRTTYANLFAAIGTNHGTANGTEFNLPDYRGRFLRMVDGSAGRDPNNTSRSLMNAGGVSGNNVGSVQGQATAKNGLSIIDLGHSHYLTADANGNLLLYNNYLGVVRNDGSDYSYGLDNGGTNSTPSRGLSGTGYANLSWNGQDSETRPLNASVNYCIKH